VGLERGPLSLLSTTQELLEEMIAVPVPMVCNNNKKKKKKKKKNNDVIVFEIYN
jgi:hypothetical protein